MAIPTYLPADILSFAGDDLVPAVGSQSSHTWVKPIEIAVLPRSDEDALLDPLFEAFTASLAAHGNRITEQPSDSTDAIITSARYGEIVSMDDALFFRAKQRFNLSHRVTIYTFVSVPRDQFIATLAALEPLRDATDEELERFSFAGMPPSGLTILREEIRRGGPIRAFSRLLQVQVKSVTTGAIIGDPATGAIDGVYLFDLVGGHPFVSAPQLGRLADSLAARLSTLLNVSQADQHEELSESVSREAWEETRAPEWMIEAGRELGERGYLTAPIQLKDFRVPALGQAISRQYSEGCLATYDPSLGVLLTTATGSARVVDKRFITRGDVALVREIKPDDTGARVMRVEGGTFVKPSVEAVELSRIIFGSARFNALNRTVPVSIIHLHMGVAGFDPSLVEYAGLDEPFYAFPVSCGTRELADGTSRALGRSSVLSNADEERRLVVLEQPTHGCILVEVGGGSVPPFQRIFQAIDAGRLLLSFDVPQGPVVWQPADASGVVRKAASGQD